MSRAGTLLPLETGREVNSNRRVNSRQEPQFKIYKHGKVLIWAKVLLPLEWRRSLGKNSFTNYLDLRFAMNTSIVFLINRFVTLGSIRVLRFELKFYKSVKNYILFDGQ